MNFSSKNKNTLKRLAEELDIEVEARKKNKPTMDELVAALEAKEQEDPEAMAAAIQELGLVDEADEEDTDEEVAEGTRIFTYVGKGESSPTRINFMGQLQFKRGVPVEVSNPELIKKLVGNPTFVEGEADADLLQDIEEEGSEHAERIRKEDKKMDSSFKKNHQGE